MDDTLFDDVAEATRSLVPPELGPLRLRARRWGVKAWFGPAQPTKEHYEAQVIGPAQSSTVTTLGIEIGFHAEHKDAAENDHCLARIDTADPKWPRDLGPEAERGPFLGRATNWRRISEVWADPDLGDAALAWEIAVRLTDYIACLEPLRGEGQL